MNIKQILLNIYLDIIADKTLANDQILHRLYLKLVIIPVNGIQ